MTVSTWAGGGEDFQFEVQLLNKSLAVVLHIQSLTNFWHFEILCYCVLNIPPTFLVYLVCSRKLSAEEKNPTI